MNDNRKAAPKKIRKEWQTPEVSVLAAQKAESGPTKVISDGAFSFGS